jgi:hypothetical protein
MWGDIIIGCRVEVMRVHGYKCRPPRQGPVAWARVSSSRSERVASQIKVELRFRSESELSGTQAITIKGIFYGSDHKK